MSDVIALQLLQSYFVIAHITRVQAVQDRTALMLQSARGVRG